MARSRAADLRRQPKETPLKIVKWILVALAAASLLGPAASAQTTEGLPPTGKSILFWTPAEQKVGYKNIEKLYKVRVVPRGAKVRPLAPAAGPEPQVHISHAGADYDLDSYIEAFNVSGLLVLKDGEIALERYGLGRGEADRWASFSVTKSITSTLVGAAIADGYIGSENDPIVRYLPELAGSAYDAVTVRQLLTMTTGVRWIEDYADAGSDVARIGREPVVKGQSPTLAYMARLPREAEPGTRFLYKTGETDLAGLLVSRATGKTLSQYLSERIWAPYGMEQEAVWMLDASEHERGGCCLSMSLRDYGRFGQFMLEGGRDVLPEGWLARATSKQTPAYVEGQGSDGYGYFWWISEGGRGYDALGIFGQMIHVDPAQGLVIVVNSAWPRANGADLQGANASLVRALTASFKDSNKTGPQ